MRPSQWNHALLARAVSVAEAVAVEAVDEEVSNLKLKSPPCGDFLICYNGSPMAHTVTIYSTPSCAYCHMAKEYFKKNSIAYTEHDVARDINKRQEMLDKRPQFCVP